MSLEGSRPASSTGNTQQLRLSLTSRQASDTRRPGRTAPRLALTPTEAAEALGVSRDTLERYILPELRVTRRGRRILISVKELERWLDASATALVEWPRG